MKTKTGMISPIVVPTYGTWPTTPRIAQAPWSQGVPLTRYVVGKGMQLQDASDLTTGRAAWQAQIRRSHSQRGRGIHGSQRSRAMVKAYANRPTQKVDRWVNRKMWRLRHKMTPETFTGKLTAGAAFGGAAAVVPAAFLGALTARALTQTKKKKKKQEGGFLKLFSSAAKAGYEVGKRKDYKRMGAKGATGHYKAHRKPWEV